MVRGVPVQDTNILLIPTGCWPAPKVQPYYCSCIPDEIPEPCRHCPPCCSCPLQEDMCLCRKYRQSRQSSCHNGHQQDMESGEENKVPALDVHDEQVRLISSSGLILLRFSWLVAEATLLVLRVGYYHHWNPPFFNFVITS